MLPDGRLVPSLAAADDSGFCRAEHCWSRAQVSVGDAYARGLDECWVWPTGTTEVFCTAQRLWRMGNGERRKISDEQLNRSYGSTTRPDCWS